MTERQFWAAVFVVFAIFLAWVGYTVFFHGNHAMPVAGCVAEKIQVGNGYGESVHVLKLDVASDQHAYVTTSTRVYFAAVVGACYKFNGPRQGTSYDSLKEKVRE